MLELGVRSDCWREYANMSAGTLSRLNVKSVQYKLILRAICWWFDIDTSSESQRDVDAVVSAAGDILLSGWQGDDITS